MRMQLLPTLTADNSSTLQALKRVDALANCFVKRNSSTRNLQLSAAAAEPVPNGLSLRELVDPSADLDEEEDF